MAQFILDENMSPDIVVPLELNGHDAIAVSQVAPRTSDSEVLAWTVQENRILVTFDTDFGALIYEQGLAAPPAVVLFRLRNMPVAAIIRLVAHVLSAARSWAGCFWVITEDSIRRRPLPRR